MTFRVSIPLIHCISTLNYKKIVIVQAKPQTLWHVEPLPQQQQQLLLHKQIGIVGDDDDGVLLDEVDKLLDLVHLRLQTLAPVLLRQRVSQERETLVLVVQLRPICAETLIKFIFFSVDILPFIQWNSFITNSSGPATYVHYNRGSL